MLTVVSLQVAVYTSLNVLIGAGVPHLLGCSVLRCQATCSNSDPCWGIGPSTLRDGADHQSPKLRAVGLLQRRLSLSRLWCQGFRKRATQMFRCYVPLQSIGLPTCSHSSSVLLAQLGPLGEGPAGSLIGPGEPASHSGGLVVALKRGGSHRSNVFQMAVFPSGRRVHLGLFESSGFGVLPARAPRGLYEV